MGLLLRHDGRLRAQQAWYSCTSSVDGHAWTKPVRAAEQSVDPNILWADAIVFGFGDNVGYGGYTGVAASGGVVHPLWIDSHDEGNQEEVFGSRIEAAGAKS